MVENTEIVGVWSTFNLNADSSVNDVIESVLMNDMVGVRTLATELGINEELFVFNFCDPDFFAANNMSFNIKKSLSVDEDGDSITESIIFTLNVFKH